MSVIYNITFDFDVKVPNNNVKNNDDMRRALDIIMENFRNLGARVTANVDVGHPHTWAGAAYTPVLTSTLWEGYTSPPAARNPTLGSGGSITGHSWNLFGWTFATGTINFGTQTGRDTGYGKWVVTLPSTPYNMSRRWIGQASLKQQYTASGASLGYNSDDIFSYSAIANPGAATISFFSDNNVATPACGLGLGGNNSSADNDDINIGQSLAHNSLLTWGIWYRTEA